MAAVLTDNASMPVPGAPSPPLGYNPAVAPGQDTPTRDGARGFREPSRGISWVSETPDAPGAGHEVRRVGNGVKP